MPEIRINIDHDKLSEVIHGLEMLRQETLPNTARSVQAAMGMIQQAWVDKTKTVFDRPTGTYAQAIQEGLFYPYNGNPLAGTVINNSPHASYIEDGTPPHDLKKALHTSQKVKISKKGKRYLIIPFRHGTPSRGSHEGGLGMKRATMQTMPKSVYAQAKNLAVSQRIRQGSGYRYTWGERLTNTQVKAAGADIKLKPEHKTNPYEGMVKFGRHPTAGGSQYMTFRVMHEDSTGWYHPGTTPLKLADKTAKEMDVPVTRMIDNGLQQDIRVYGIV